MLTEAFRLDYCHLWQSLIWTDMEKVKKYSQCLGAGELYPLFACMLTARSWDSINRGISHAPVTASEVRSPSQPYYHPNARDRTGLWMLPKCKGQCVRFLIGERSVHGRRGSPAALLDEEQGGRRDGVHR